MIATSKSILIFIALIALGAVGLTLVSQYHFHLRPCAWCVLQRLIALVMAIVCLLAAYSDGIASLNVSRVMRKLGASLTILLGMSGIAAAFYQHTISAKQLACSPTFAERFITATGLDAVLPSIFGIYALCMQASVKILGLEYSLWSLILFVGVVLLGAIALFKP